MFSWFYKRSAPAPIPHEPCRGETLRTCIEKGGGVYFENFPLFDRDGSLRVDLLLFFPTRGLFIGETIPWDAEELKGTSVERASRRSKKTPATQMESTEFRLRRKLQDVLSFDSTVCERFFWMKSLTEEEFDRLDSSFHELLPKERLIFCGEGCESVLAKITALAEERSEPYSEVKVLGSLRAHTLLLPTPELPFGSFLSDEQRRFLDTPLTSVTALAGNSGSGKSTVLIRKILDWLLHTASGNILVLTPTRLGGELLRLELVSLIEHSALKVDLARIVFSALPELDRLHGLKALQDAALVVCDDIDRGPAGTGEALMVECGGQPLVFSTSTAPDVPCDIVLLENAYHPVPRIRRLASPEDRMVATLMVELRKRLETARPQEVMIVTDPSRHFLLREAVDEYLGLECTLIDTDFSLQYGNLDQMLVVAPNAAYVLTAPHLFLVFDSNSAENEFLLSRASETATIITVSHSTNPFRQET